MLCADFSPLSLDGGGLIGELPFVDPARVFAPLAGEPFALLLESARTREEQGGRWSFILTNPCSRLVVPAGEAGYGRSFERLRAALHPRAGMMAFAQAATRAFRERLDNPPPPFMGGIAGLFGYELAHALERLPMASSGPATPDMAVGVYDTVLAFDHKTCRVFLLCAGQQKEYAHLLQGWPSEPPPPVSHAPQDTARRFPASGAAPVMPDTITSNFTRSAYKAAVAQVVEHIRAGDIFQANLSQRFEATLMPEDTPFDVYTRLRCLSPAPFAGFFNLGEAAVVSASPERFVACRNGFVETRPIKGTRPRGRTASQDRALAAELEASPKDRAENIMIVDLLRNDLSKVCADHSVKTEKLCVHETYPNVHHLVSTITGRLRPGLGPVDLLAACFPGGSITGAPKIRAMEIITDIENTRRGAYCGALGYIGVDGAMDTSIAIRTITIEERRVFFQAGGGITAASDPADEYEETLVKAAAMATAVALPATLRKDREEHKRQAS